MNFSATRWRAAIVATSLLMTGLYACEKGGDVEQPATADLAEVRTNATTEKTAVVSRSVSADSLPYADIDEKLVYGYFAYPADMAEPLPAIMLIHEHWGLDAPIREISQRLAGEGYLVVAIDLFGGETATSPGAARVLEIDVFENPERATDNIRQAYQFIKDTFGSPTVASVGIGFGGGWSLGAALILPDKLDASVIVYGQVINDQDKLLPVQGPILGLFADEDPVISRKSVLEFETALDVLDKEFVIEFYGGAKRGFVDTHSENYDAQIAERAWDRTLKFLKRHRVVAADQAY